MNLSERLTAKAEKGPELVETEIIRNQLTACLTRRDATCFIRNYGMGRKVEFTLSPTTPGRTRHHLQHPTSPGNRTSIFIILPYIGGFMQITADFPKMVKW